LAEQQAAAVELVR